MRPSEGTLSLGPGEPLKSSLSTIGDFLVNFVIITKKSFYIAVANLEVREAQYG